MDGKIQPTIALEEMKRDLEATNQDIARLRLIVDNISGFIREADGENRSFLRTDLYK